MLCSMFVYHNKINVNIGGKKRNEDDYMKTSVEKNENCYSTVWLLFFFFIDSFDTYELLPTKLRSTFIRKEF